MCLTTIMINSRLKSHVIAAVRSYCDDFHAITISAGHGCDSRHQMTHYAPCTSDINAPCRQVSSSL